MPTRFQLEDATIDAFGDEFLVVCPNCQARALVRDRGVGFQPRIVLTCGGCGHIRNFQGDLNSTMYSPNAGQYPPGVRCVGGPVDWYFHQPLWLQAPCCGETLWAYNLRHLAFIEDFVRATLRENYPGEHGWSNQSLRNRFPDWIKDAGNRETILKRIVLLRQRA